MKHTIVCKIAAVALAGGAVLSATPALAGNGSDAFDRPALGSKWVVPSGTLSISSDALVGSSGAIGVNTPSAGNTAASVVVFLGGTDTEYGAVALGNITGSSNAFVKIQSQNGGGTFDHAAFYTGNNGGGNFFALSSAVPSPAIIDVFFCKTTATLRITSAAGVQTYTNDYGATFAKGAGLGTYGSVRLDNYVAFAGSCSSAPNAIPANTMPHDTDKSLAK